ncbi:response regulator transcription factor [Aurantibacillus circumpalustris]|uniref:response regulator transcription factor n=1 Tax=Aurantibacillus circumpalustris TaxID=3036359 RepID=UPI00295A788C|nr:response regulator transcription factor [Aurantibacillus circumpalustris]
MQFQPHIFIVEDEENLANTISLNLKFENYLVSIARNGSEALQFFKKNQETIHLVILDVMLPDINGFDLCKEFKNALPDLPVIFLTAKNQMADKIDGLKLGADDYITKPFDLEELLLRISNLLKRTQKENTAVFSFDNCHINFQTFEIMDAKGTVQTLSKREIGLLELLTANTNKVISRDEIIEKLWDVSENASSRTIDNYILNFRKYFEKDPKNPQHFHSVRGVGYKFIVNS